MRHFNGGAGPRQLRRQRREHADAFKYTPEEAKFCDAFDTYAARWEADERKMVADASFVRCDICLELKPPWMSQVVKVSEGDTLLHSLRGNELPDDDADDKCDPPKPSTRERWDAYVRDHCAGKWLCTRCRSPSRVEKEAGMHKFSKLNDAHLRERTPSFDASELDARLREDPYAAFAIATDAEAALIRMTIPWCAPLPRPRPIAA